MSPVYDRTNGHCIDHRAVAMVAAAQRLPLGHLNWCVGPGLDSGRYTSRSPSRSAPSAWGRSRGGAGR